MPMNRRQALQTIAGATLGATALPMVDTEVAGADAPYADLVFLGILPGAHRLFFMEQAGAKRIIYYDLRSRQRGLVGQESKLLEIVVLPTSHRSDHPATAAAWQRRVRRKYLRVLPCGGHQLRGTSVR